VTSDAAAVASYVRTVTISATFLSGPISALNTVLNLGELRAGYACSADASSAGSFGT